MLDLNHPRTPHVIAAFQQLGLIGDYASRISYADSKSRLRMLEVVLPCFAALRWLQTQRFPEEPHIAAGIDELEAKMEQLVQLGDGRVEWSDSDTPPVNCPVCNAALTTHGVYEPRPGLQVPRKRWCSPCLQVVTPALERSQSIQYGFGIEAI